MLAKYNVWHGVSMCTIKCTVVILVTYISNLGLQNAPVVYWN